MKNLMYVALFFLSVQSLHAQSSVEEISRANLQKVADLSTFCKKDSDCIIPSLAQVKQALNIVAENEEFVQNELSKFVKNISNDGDLLIQELENMKANAQENSSKAGYEKLIEKVRTGYVTKEMFYIESGHELDHSRLKRILESLASDIPSLLKTQAEIKAAIPNTNTNAELQNLSEKSNQIESKLKQAQKDIHFNAGRRYIGIKIVFNKKSISTISAITLDDIFSDVSENCQYTLRAVPVNSNLLKFVLEGNGKGLMKVSCERKSKLTPAYDAKKHRLNIYYSKTSKREYLCGDLLMVPCFSKKVSKKSSDSEQVFELLNKVSQSN